MRAALARHVVLLVLVAIELAIDYGRLPARVALHFRADGTADGWASPPLFLALMLGIAVSFAGFTHGVAWLTTRLPQSLLNLPSRDYWLAPERRAETRAFLARQVTHVGTGALVLFALVLELVLRINVDGSTWPQRLFLPLVVGYVAFTSLWLVRLVRRFRVPPR